jgi:hypothetical protein
LAAEQRVESLLISSEVKEEGLVPEISSMYAGGCNVGTEVMF